MPYRRLSIVILLAAVLGSGAVAPAATTSPGSAVVPIKATDLLARIAGVWDATMQMASEGGAPPIILNGTEVNTLGGNGTWVVGDFRSQLDGRPFQGHAVLARDGASGRFRRVWADSSSPVFWLSEGEWEPATSTLTMWIETVDSSGAKVRWREETVFKDLDTRTFTMFVPGPATTEAAGVTIMYHRRRDGVAPRTPIGPAVKPPSPGHAILFRDVGTWTAEVDDRMDPDRPAGSSKATETNATCCSGQFLVIDFASQSRKPPSFGHGLIGFDPEKKTYTCAWVDTVGTLLRLSAGVYEPQGDTLTLRIDLPDGKGGTVALREVEEWKGQDRRTMTVWTADAGGRDRAAVVTRYHRAR
jgi:hypothetical protein